MPVCDQMNIFMKFCIFPQAPEPIESWKPEIFDAFDFGNTCIQPNGLTKNPYPQSEDCLYLNVFIPGEAYYNNIFIVHIHTKSSPRELFRFVF